MIKHKYSNVHNKKITDIPIIYGNILINNLNNPFVTKVDSDIKFCFVVGCGNSGTTLLAAKSGNHPKINLIARETNIFSPSKGLYCSKEVVKEWIYQTRCFNNEIVLEKTPKHIHSIERIRKLLPHATFFITIRNPLDNCASLYKRYGDLKFAVDRWLMDNKKIDYYSRDENIHVIKYEDMVSDPESTFKFLCNKLNITYSDTMLYGNSKYSAVKPYDDNMELRSKQVDKPIYNNIGSHKSILDNKQIEYVSKRTRGRLNNYYSYD